MYIRSCSIDRRKQGDHRAEDQPHSQLALFLSKRQGHLAPQTLQLAPKNCERGGPGTPLFMVQLLYSYVEPSFFLFFFS